MTDVAVVIPTLDGADTTLQSVPDGVETYVVSDGTRGEARNIGAYRSDADVLVFCDDDIEFSEHTFWREVGDTPGGVVSGLADYEFGMLLTRFMVIHREDFDRVGGFDSRMQHMEDTEFCIRCQKHRVGLRQIPRTVVEHHDHENDVDNLARAKWLVYTIRKHPWWFGPKVANVASVARPEPLTE